MSLAAASIEIAPEAGRKRDDRRLATDLLAGAPGAAGRAWTTFAPVVLRLLRRHLGAGPDQQDLSQEVFIRLFSRIRELRDRGALRTFVLNICLGVAQNELRRRRVRRRLGLTDTGTLPERAISGADFEARQALARCRHLLDGLGDDDRSLFVLRYLEQMELEEIAAALAWTRSKTKRRLPRVTARVTRLMQCDPALAEYARKTAIRTSNDNHSGWSDIVDPAARAARRPAR
jgi:RNA polymerase sigma-70 factor (ECF subfamily)